MGRSNRHPGAMHLYVSAAHALRRVSPAGYQALRRVVERNPRLATRVRLRAELPLTAHPEIVAAAVQRHVALLALGSDPATVLPWVEQFRDARVHVLSAADGALRTAAGRTNRAGFKHHRVASVDDIDEALKTMRPAHVIVDLMPGTMETHQRTWRRLFFHLPPGGRYLLDRLAVQGVRLQPGVQAWMAAIMPEGGTSAPPGWRNLADATKSATASASLFVIEKRGKHYLKLRDAEVDRVLPVREPHMHVSELLTLPAGELHSAAEVVSHESSVPIPWLPERMPYPPMHLRHYTGRISFYGGTLFCTNRSILPDSFRWHLEPIPRNPKIRSMSDEFAKLKPRSRPAETLSGDFYQLDPQFSGHFGHIMTEVVGRLWGWDEARRQLPGVRAIFRVNNPDRQGEQVQRRLLRAYGIPDDDIVVVDHPVDIESLVSATVMWHNADPHYTHPALREVWDRLRSNLADPEAPTYERIFISRTEQFWRRSCRNIRAVEEFFAAHGFTIVHPEKLDLSAQVTMFAAARVVAGFGGSALFNIMYAEKLECLIVLNHEAYIARNEHLYTALTGGAVHYFWSEPDVPQPKSFTSGADRRWSGDAFVSGWEFDFDRNRAALEQVLAAF